MAISREAVKEIVDFCNDQRGCKNCIFGLRVKDHWECCMYAFDLQGVFSNIEANIKIAVGLRRHNNGC